MPATAEMQAIAGMPATLKHQHKQGRQQKDGDASTSRNVSNRRDASNGRDASNSKAPTKAGTPTTAGMSATLIKAPTKLGRQQQQGCKQHYRGTIFSRKSTAEGRRTVWCIVFFLLR
jgi:hypothetical protein